MSRPPPYNSQLVESNWLMFSIFFLGYGKLVQIFHGDYPVRYCSNTFH